MTERELFVKIMPSIEEMVAESLKLNDEEFDGWIGESLEHAKTQRATVCRLMAVTLGLVDRLRRERTL